MRLVKPNLQDKVIVIDPQVPIYYGQVGEVVDTRPFSKHKKWFKSNKRMDWYLQAGMYDIRVRMKDRCALYFKVGQVLLIPQEATMDQVKALVSLTKEIV